MKKFMFVIVLALCLLACAPRIEKVDSGTAQSVLSNISYIKDSKTGLCYAMFTTTKVGDANSNTVSITWVPCEKVEPYLQK